MTKSQKFDKASGVFFFIAFMVSTLQYVPFLFVAGGLRLISLLISLGAYGLKLASNLYSESYDKQKHTWYGFDKINKQFTYSSLANILATIVSIVAIFYPICFPPAAWLFFIGNVLSSIAEYHTLKSPPKDDKFCYTSQDSTVSYQIVISIISLITAITATLIFVFPPFAIPISIVGILLSAGFGALALEFRLDSIFGEHIPSRYPPNCSKESYAKGAIDRPVLDKTPIKHYPAFRDPNNSSTPNQQPTLATSPSFFKTKISDVVKKFPQSPENSPAKKNLFPANSKSASEPLENSNENCCII